MFGASPSSDHCVAPLRLAGVEQNPIGEPFCRLSVTLMPPRVVASPDGTPDCGRLVGRRPAPTPVRAPAPLRTARREGRP